MTNEPQKDKHPAYYVQSLERGLAIIRAFGNDNPAMTIAEVAGKTDMSRPAARRFLLTLVDLNYASKDGNTFRLRPEILNLGFSFLSSLDIWKLGQPYLDELAKDINETCSISILDDTDIVYIARTYVQRLISAEIGVGSRLPAYVTSMGRVLLSSLSSEQRGLILQKSDLRQHTPHTVCDIRHLEEILNEVKQQKYALVDQELGIGLLSIAVPVKNRFGQVIAALNVSSQPWRTTKEHMINCYLPKLEAIVADMEPKLIA